MGSQRLVYLVSDTLALLRLLHFQAAATNEIWSVMATLALFHTCFSPGDGEDLIGTATPALIQAAPPTFYSDGHTFSTPGRNLVSDSHACMDPS
jgi:hypothetical protein